ncbi:MAG: 16S rRNA (cytidine(1402)-2'-O)-methyltransferase [Candidatus Adiutrix sp.]|jgi:16S rRNA (cytidine1402-2'-O)-methyltransferase|nr:16S rRNA (cytidine(1402)-2'-O)-methyltransferase [Candidatus Adiutrix sp.]
MEERERLAGGLWLVPGPLGNLGDLTRRAAEALAEADLVCAEDTRRALKLLSHLGLRRRLMSYREQNHRRAWPKIAEVLAGGGRVALLTDAGSPAVSDPGAELARAARAAGYPVSALPGPSAVITALAASGLPADRFAFAGFLPARPVARRAFLAGLARWPWTLVFFETPHRLAESLADLAEVFGPRPACLAREMTKLHEEYLAADLAGLAREAAENPRQGEITLVVAGFEGGAEPEPLDLEAIERAARSDPRPTRMLAAELAARWGRSRGEIYNLLVRARGGPDHSAGA